MQLRSERILWNPCIPTKVTFFACEVWWGKMITLNQLKRRWCALANKRSFCGEDEENIEHILLHCSMVRELLTLLFALVGIDWVLPYLMRDFLLGWKGAFMKKSHMKIWMAASFCLFWTIWRRETGLFLTMKCFPSKGWKILLSILFGLGLECSYPNQQF